MNVFNCRRIIQGIWSTADNSMSETGKVGGWALEYLIDIEDLGRGMI
jgi:hypothetical protein